MIIKKIINKIENEKNLIQNKQQKKVVCNRIMIHQSLINK